MTSMTKMTKKRAEAKQSWGVAAAKTHLSELIDLTLRDGPQTITRNGRAAVILVSAEEWQRKTSRHGNLAEFLTASPLRGSGLQIERIIDRPRELEK